MGKQAGRPSFEAREVYFRDDDSCESYPIGDGPRGETPSTYGVYKNLPDGTQEFVKDGMTEQEAESFVANNP